MAYEKDTDEKPSKGKRKGKDADYLADVKAKFKEAQEAETKNRERGLEDLRFARLGEQWPDEIRKQRAADHRPMLTVNRMPSFIRQVVNDARQNKPSVKVRPVDSGSDPETAEIFNGVIRNIESTSSADIAYDTAVESAVSVGFGYWRVGLEYAHDDTFEMDITVEEVADPFTVYGDPYATSKDGSDWMCAFVVERMPETRFKQKYPDADTSSFDAEDRSQGWMTDDGVLVAEYWSREEVQRRVVMLSDGTVMDAELLDEEDMAIRQVAVTQERMVPSWKVKQCLLTGAEIIEEREWPGKYIPIVPVYGDEVNVEGERIFLSLIHHAKDPQRMLNFWRTAGSELVALAPRTPFIGPESAFGGIDTEKWQTANTKSHPTLSYPDRAPAPPQRQQLDVTAVGPMQEALNAQDDIKATIGLFDAALGAQSNETSGKAILARQREGDVSTFHFLDNLTRSIRHSGRILLDLIPHVWTEPRIVRLMGEDGAVTEQKVNQPVPVMDEETGQPQMEPDPSRLPYFDQAIGQRVQPMRQKMQVFDLTAGKYDLTATAGPSYTTKREEAASQMIELIRAFPAAAPFIGDLLAKNLDWPGADEIAERLKALVPQQAGGGIPPELQKQIDEGMKELQQLRAENQQLKSDMSLKAAELDLKKGDQALKGQEIAIKREELGIKQFEAQTDRMQALKPEPAPAQPRPKAA